MPQRCPTKEARRKRRDVSASEAKGANHMGTRTSPAMLIPAPRLPIMIGSGSARAWSFRLAREGNLSDDPHAVPKTRASPDEAQLQML